MPDPDFAFPDLMPIDTPREDGVDPAPPLMKTNFTIPGLEEPFTPVSDEVNAPAE